MKLFDSCQIIIMEMEYAKKLIAELRKGNNEIINHVGDIHSIYADITSDYLNYSRTLSYKGLSMISAPDDCLSFFVNKNKFNFSLKDIEYLTFSDYKIDGYIYMTIFYFNDKNETELIKISFMLLPIFINDDNDINTLSYSLLSEDNVKFTSAHFFAWIFDGCSFIPIMPK